MGINYGRVMLVAAGIPLVLLAVLGTFAIAGDYQLQTVGRELGLVVAYEGQRVAYGLVMALAVAAAVLVTRGLCNRWWMRHGEPIANRLLRDRIDDVRRERNALADELEVREAELREAQATIKAGHEAAGMAATAAGRVQLALASLPAPANGHRPALRRVN